MGQSKRYKQMLIQLKKIETHLLPRKFSPIGNYPNEIFTRTNAYRVLSHAEIENYIEDRVLEIVNKSQKKWDRKKRASKVLLCLLAFSENNTVGIPSTLCPPQTNQTDIWDEKLHLEKRITKVITNYYVSVKNNHGIKEENILKLLLPVGINPEDLDSLWLTQMSNFGVARGETAHTSAYKLKQLPDPKTELNTINSLLSELDKIDNLLSDLLR